MGSPEIECRSQNIIESLGLKLFRPLPFIQSGMAQTIASAYWPSSSRNFSKFADQIHDVLLDDGDRLKIVENRPASWRPGDRITVLIHGLTGHHESNYMTRLNRRLCHLGFLVLRVNLRGCGIGAGLARNPYHSGRSEDARAIVLWAQKQFGDSPVTVVGVSLGANIVLKMAGEDGPSPSGNMDSFVAVSPPANLAMTARHIVQSHNKVFDQFFVWKLKYDVWRFHQKFPDIIKPPLPLRMTLTDFDEYYTAPRSGFAGAQDYYARASSGPFVSQISTKGLVLVAQDDPVVHAQSVCELPFPSQVQLVAPEQGGHVGFLGLSEGGSDVQWMDNIVTKWIQRHDAEAGLA